MVKKAGNENWNISMPGSSYIDRSRRREESRVSGNCMIRVANNKYK